MMTIKTENWLGEFVSTIGTGDAILGGAIDGFAGFSNVGDDVDVYYTIIDGLDKETGIGTLTGGKLVRKDIHATLVDGSYVKNGSAINLSGNAQVYGTANAHFLDYVQAVANAEIVNTQAIAELKALQINGHALTASFNLTAADVGAHPDSWMPSTEALNVYQKDASDIRYLKTQDAEQVAGLVMRVGGAREQQLQQSIDGFESRIDEALRRSYAEAGYNLVDGSFEAGGTVTTATDVLLYESEGKAYSWGGALHKVVPAGSSPTSTGGVTLGAWSNVGSVILRQELAAPSGAGLVGGLAKPVTWVGFAGGADPTGVRNSTAAFQAANASQRKIYVPAGKYKLTADIVSDPLTSWEMEMGVLFIGGYWLRQVPWMAGLGNNIYFYLERHSRNVGIAPNDGIGIFGSAHSGGGSGGGAALAVAGMAYNDDTSGTRSSVWSLYGSTVRNAGTVGASHGLELDIANRGDEQELYPNSMFPNGQTNALWLGSGGELTQAGETLNAASVAIGIIANDKTPGKTARFLKGIVFANNSLKGTDGESTGRGVAIAFGNRHSMTWYNNSNNKTAEIISTREDDTRSNKMMFSDNGVTFARLSSGLPIFNIETGPATPVNYLSMRSQTASNPPAVGAAGGDDDIDLRLSPKGTGTVRVDSSITPTSPGSTSTVGTAGRVWAGGFTQTAFTVTSDERYKSAPEEITDAMLDAAAEVDWCMFQYLDRVEAKGADGARWHFGAIAQRFVEAFERHGLDPYRFAFICYDEWAGSPELIGEDGEVISPAVDAGSRYGIRYEQAIILKQKQIERDHKRQLDALVARIEALESN